MKRERKRSQSRGWPAGPEMTSYVAASSASAVATSAGFAAGEAVLAVLPAAAGLGAVVAGDWPGFAVCCCGRGDAAGERAAGDAAISPAKISSKIPMWFPSSGFATMLDDAKWELIALCAVRLVGACFCEA